MRTRKPFAPRKTARVALSAGQVASALQDARALAWAGQQEAAVEACTRALAAAAPAQRMALLEQRAESLAALGRTQDAEADAAAMLALATEHPAQVDLMLIALDSQAAVLIRQGRLQAALKAAAEAVERTHAASGDAQRAQALVRLAEVQFRTLDNADAIANAQRAIAIFDALGDTLRLGRAYWVLAFAHSRQSDATPSREAALRALTLARESGDALGQGNALNVLSFTVQDLAERIAYTQQAIAAFERCGHLFGRGMAIGNLCLALAELGLYRRAYRQGQELLDLCRDTGARLNLTLQQGGMLGWLIAQGELDTARAIWPEYEALVTEVNEPLTRAHRAMYASELAYASGDTKAAVRHLKAALTAPATEKAADRRVGLTALARALLADGQAAAALEATEEATRLHRAQGLGRADLGRSQEIWWRHAQALAANDRAEDAWTALQQAHALLLEGVRNVRDEGLRRSYLNKVETNREIVFAWLRESGTRKLPKAERLAHLRIESTLTEPFKRLVDTGTRLNQLRGSAELQDFLIDEITELSGAERVLLVLDGADGARIAGALLPRGEDAADLLRAITPWLDEARSTREARLRHGPQGAAEVDQRSCLVAPLVAQGRVTGFVYADIEGAFGRFGDIDRDLIGMLAGQAAVALDNAQWAQGLEAKVAERTGELREALEHQTATAEVLKAISRSTFDLKTVLTTLISSATRLCEASHGFLFRPEGAALRLAVSHGAAPEFEAHIAHIPVRPERGFLIGRVALSRQPVQILDALADPDYSQAESQRLGGYRTMLGVPMLSGEHLVGVIVVWRQEVRAFGNKQIELLTTFADQAAIAIENVRLFNQTQEALERQTATADILKVIAESPADVQPVFDIIAERAAHLTGAAYALVCNYDGEWIHVVSSFGVDAAGLDEVRTVYPLQPGSATITARAVRDAAVAQEADVLALADADYPSKNVARRVGFRSVLSVPMLRDGRPVGAISVMHPRTGAFATHEVELLQTFADQAVIAIENVRLFNETQEALERQTATAEVLQVISSSVTDTQPVFDAIVQSCQRLFGGMAVNLLMVSGDTLLRAAVASDGSPTSEQAVSHWPLDHGSVSGACVLDSRMLIVADCEQIGDDYPRTRDLAVALGWRSGLMVPLLRQGKAIGCLAIVRAVAGSFDDREVSLAQTFADQAVIAIENVRLFHETNEALERQTATAEVLQVISSSVTDTQPVFDAIVRSCHRLFDGKAVSLVMPRDAMCESVAYMSDSAGAGISTNLEPWPLDRGSGAGTCILDARVVNVADTLKSSTEFARMPDLAIALGYRSCLFVPLMRDGAALGCLAILRATTGAFD
ncbi:MAG: GAF domain-containing protein, partial [Burkholderiaceae bacterium]|nr:GAF domain-containing protein [Burkholderiaceae bacterium]